MAAGVNKGKDGAGATPGKGHSLRLGPLQRKLGYQFADEALLIRALTHRSASGKRNNERLEYLGDAVLGYVTAAHLYGALPKASESVLTLARSALVKRAALAEVACALNLGEHLAFGAGELRCGAQSRASILADALEALIGAVHEDGGIDAARAFTERLLAERLADPAPSGKDPKSTLQECLQAHAFALPAYRILEETGPQHERRFLVCCQVPALGLTANGEGVTRKSAEKEAAAAMLRQLEAQDAAG